MTNQSNPVTPSGIARWKLFLLSMGICACIGALFAVYTLIKYHQFRDDAKELSESAKELREERATDEVMPVQEEPVVEEPVEDTIVPVESPKTGNPAAIGLIPVALAAAAIIAKRKSDIDR